MTLKYLSFAIVSSAFAFTACGSMSQLASKTAQESGDQAKSAADDAKRDAKKRGEEAADDAKAKAEDAADDAKAAGEGAVAGVVPTEKLVGSATVTLESKSRSKVKGSITFSEYAIGSDAAGTAGWVEISYDLSGLPKGAVRGFHVHEHGDCSAADASSAGGHFNPGGHEHGAMEAPNSHAGDLGNIVADAKGNAKGTFRVPSSKFSLVDGEADNIVGRSVIVHSGTDDFKSQPTGNAGARAACGVIVKK